MLVLDAGCAGAVDRERGACNHGCACDVLRARGESSCVPFLSCDEAGIASCRPGASDDRCPKYHCCRLNDAEGGAAKSFPWLHVHCTLCVCAACRKTTATADGWFRRSICCMSSRSEALECEACEEAARHDLVHLGKLRVPEQT
jgi:hypothetical protein